MKLEKMRTYLDVLTIIRDHERIWSKLIGHFLRQKGSAIAYYTLNKMLKVWAEEGYIERLEIPNKKLRMGGPKYTYVIAGRGWEFLKALEDRFGKEITNQPEINPKEFVENISSELGKFIQDQKN